MADHNTPEPFGWLHDKDRTPIIDRKPQVDAPPPLPKKSKRGFGGMSKAKQKEIASKGGRAAHIRGTAHEWNSATAREAGHKGGEKVSANREHMAAIGRKGGLAKHTNNKGKTKRTSDKQSDGAGGSGF